MAHFDSIMSVETSDIKTTLKLMGKTMPIKYTLYFWLPSISGKNCCKPYWCQCYHRFRWYTTLENKTPAEMFPKFPSVLRVIDRSGQNPPITATSVTFRPSLCHASGLWLVDFDPICQEHVWLMEILETFPRVFCFRKSHKQKRW